MNSVTWGNPDRLWERPKTPGRKTGTIAVLHTWGQNLQLHPHLHCIVPKGGVSKAGFWKKGKRKDDFLFPVKAQYGHCTETSLIMWSSTKKEAIKQHNNDLIPCQGSRKLLEFPLILKSRISQQVI